MTGRGVYVAFEGIDTSGKTSQARLLADRLGALATREPGGTALGEAMRQVLLHDEHLELTDRAEALLFAADRAQHVALVVEPALASGRHVVTDRSYGSTLAYQGYGRGLPLDRLHDLVAWASTTGSAAGPPQVLLPDVVVLLEISEDEMRRRMSDRPDRIESEPGEFLQRVAEGFRRLASADEARWRRVDADGTPEDVAERVWAALADGPGAAALASAAQPSRPAATSS
ncbi:MAG TPA: dTMP kinase [Acidimicrobiaceae bacterium]|nr:dTMP kinase [Acidimicrobiaceae bacterium]HCB37089.1 dTMP kinase [Acidimicrobiaceae bacterium]